MNVSIATLLRVALLAGLLFAASPASASDALATFGAIVDTRSADPEGLRVMAVTPGSTADTMGVRAGDRLLGVNGVDVTAAGNVSASLRNALSSSRQVRLDVDRGGNTLSLSGTMAASAPVLAGCGYVTSQGPTPSVTQDIHPVEITQIDGKSTPLKPLNRHRLGAGTHALVVRELIPPTQFTNVQNRDRAREHRFQRGSFYKTLLVDIAPDTRYSVGARLVLGRGQAGKQDIIDKSYWEPVVWRESREPCD